MKIGRGESGGSESSGDETDSEGSGSDFDVEKGEMTLDQRARGLNLDGAAALDVQGFEGGVVGRACAVDRADG